MMFPTKMRLKFEKWAGSNRYDVCRKMLTSYPPKDGGYVSPTTQAMWEAWQAAVDAYQKLGDE